MTKNFFHILNKLMLPRMNGAYVLLMHIGRSATTGTGSLGKLHFRKGVYAYVGSALNGLDPRISRHLSKRKENMHWHIDYLTSSPYASTECVIMGETSKRVECKVSKAIASKPFSSEVPAFGSSDCTCKSHLYRIDMSIDESLREMKEIFFALGLSPVVLHV
jgi:Uri superfamily endonuclease